MATSRLITLVAFLFCTHNQPPSGLLVFENTRKVLTPLMGLSGWVKTMGRQVTAEDLNLNDEEDVTLTTAADADPKKDSSASPFADRQEREVQIGAEAFEKEVEEAKVRQKKAEEDQTAAEIEKIEGKKDKKKDVDEEQRLQYKDQVAAEKAVKEAKKKMTEATTKAAKLEKIISDLEKRVATASKEAPDTSPAENPWDTKRQKVADETIAKAAAIASPPPPQDRDDPDFDAKWADYQKKMGEYNSKVAKAWADAQSEIAKLAIEEQEEAKRNKESVISAVNSALEEAELISDKTTAKEKEGILKLFWSMSTDVSKSLPMEDQIQETINLCKEFVDELRGKERDRARKEKENQEDLQVLGRGTRVTTQKEPEFSHTMAEATRMAKERRVLRRNP